MKCRMVNTDDMKQNKQGTNKRTSCCIKIKYSKINMIKTGIFYDVISFQVNSKQCNKVPDSFRTR